MKTVFEAHDEYRIKERAELYRNRDRSFAGWAAGYGVIQHDDLTQVRIYEMVDLMVQRGELADKKSAYHILASADRIASAGLWLVVHMTYAQNVYVDGRNLDWDDFKADPEGHTGGSLNMVLAYSGYMAANALAGKTRSWLMGQGHCVAGIDAVNLVLGNMTPAHAQRYDWSDAGLSRLVRDFYSYKCTPEGTPESPLGSHVNVHTAGGMMEGGYLGFAELQYVHMPLPGESLVVFLSDGAFEEQRGSDWAARWWRAEDSGMVCPIMIANGRRIDQQTTMKQEGGTEWFRKHLRLNGFEPLTIDGKDPAAYAWAVFDMEENLRACSLAVKQGSQSYPVPLHYAIAEVPKGFGFPGAGTNLAHNLPLGENPAQNAEARGMFNSGARSIWVPAEEIAKAVKVLNNHETSGRVRERDHALIRQSVTAPRLPEPPWTRSQDKMSPMAGVSDYLREIVKTNPQLRPRIGNPDEMSSNKMSSALKVLKHRVTDPEPGVDESVTGSVITALNEEAVVCAALANKGGLNMVISYEAFAIKMLGAIRQELIFARHQKEAEADPQWIGVPVIATSHTWENGKNEQSHQDPTFVEAMLGEMSDVSRVVFPPDWNSAVAALRKAYSSRGVIWTMVIPKREVANHLKAESAVELADSGAISVYQDDEPRIILTANGAYQLEQCLLASARLRQASIAHSVVYMIEPGRFRDARDTLERANLAESAVFDSMYPDETRPRIFLTHMRPEAFAGVIRPLDTGIDSTKILGYINRGGTLDVHGMMFANRSTWAHVLKAVADVLQVSPTDLLSDDELKAVEGRIDPSILWSPAPELSEAKT